MGSEHRKREQQAEEARGTIQKVESCGGEVVKTGTEKDTQIEREGRGQRRVEGEGFADFQPDEGVTKGSFAPPSKPTFEAPSGSFRSIF